MNAVIGYIWIIALFVWVVNLGLLLFNGPALLAGTLSTYSGFVLLAFGTTYIRRNAAA